MKRHASRAFNPEKTSDEGGAWRHVKVTLRPVNSDFEPIVIAAEGDADVAVVAELVEVLAPHA